jgi:hypothetical protein
MHPTRKNIALNTLSFVHIHRPITVWVIIALATELRSNNHGGSMKRIICFMSICLLLLAVCLGTPFQVVAADQATDAKKERTPEEMKQFMDATFGAMVPMMAKITEIAIQTQLKEGAKLETAAQLATFKKNLYDALIKQGFSKQDAFQIMLNTSLPSATPSTK